MTHSENSTDVALINQVLLVDQKQRTLFYKYVEQSLTAKINVSNRMIDQLTINQEIVKKKLIQASTLNSNLTKERNDLTALQSSLQSNSASLSSQSSSLQSQLNELRQQEATLLGRIRDEERKRENAAADWIPGVGFFAGLITGDYDRMIPGYSTITGIISSLNNDKEALQNRLNQKNDEYKRNIHELNRIKAACRANSVKIGNATKNITLTNRHICECESTTKCLGEKHTAVLNDILVLKNMVSKIQYQVELEVQNVIEFDLNEELGNIYSMIRQVIDQEVSLINRFILKPDNAVQFEKQLLEVSTSGSYIAPESEKLDMHFENGVPSPIQAPMTIQGPVTFKSAHGTYLRAQPGGEGSKLDLQTQADEWEQFTIQPNRAFIKSYHGTFLSAQPGGEGSTIDLKANKGSWETFTIETVDDFYVALRSCHGTVLRAQPGGEGATLDLQTQVGDWEKFSLELLDDGLFAIKSFHGTYLRAHESNSIVDMQTQVGDWEKFTIIPIDVSIKSCHATYLRAQPGGEGSLVDLQTQVGDWETFTIEPIKGNVVYIKSSHGTVLRAHPGGEGSKVDLQTQVGDWEKFVLASVY